MPRNKQEANTKAKRRAHNEGSIYYRADVKLWYGKVLTGRKTDGSPQYTYVKAKKQEDVRTKVNALVREVDTNGFSIATSHVITNFGQAFYDWYSVFKADSVTNVTNEKNMGLMRLHIIPALGKYEIKDIDTVHIQRFINSMKKQKLEGGFGYSNDSKCGYSSDYIRKAKSLLDQFFKYALRKSLVTANPVVDVKVGIVVGADNMDLDDEGKALTPELRVAVFQAVENHAVLKPILLTLAMQGLRTQELIAMQWKHVDFDKKELRVRQAVKRVASSDEMGNIISRGSKLGKLKTTSSLRNIAIPSALLDVLCEWREYCTQNGIKTDREAYVFPNTSAGKINERRSYSGLRSLFRRFLAKYNLEGKGLTLYMFRHTFATMLLEEKVNPKIVAEMMGHANIKTTLNIYSTVFKAVYAEAADTLNRAFVRMGCSKTS